MDITNFVVSGRNQALLYGDYATYHHQLAQKLHNIRKKLGIITKNRHKSTSTAAKTDISPSQVAENHEYLHLLLLTAERNWAQAMRYKAVHSTDTAAITGRTRSHIISRLDKAARFADQVARLLADPAASAPPARLLEARAYAALLRGAARFEKQDWQPCVQSYATARIIYQALGAHLPADVARDLLAETIDPSIRYAAYRSNIPRTQAIPTIARNAFPGDEDLVRHINELSPDLLADSAADAQHGQVGAPDAPQSIAWRGRNVHIEDAAIAVALASAAAATTRLSDKLASSQILLPKDMAAAYDDVLIASQDAADATKRAIDELKDEGVSQNDPRIQSLQITRTAVNYRMVSWRIGRNRVLTGEHDGALLDSAPDTTRKAKKAAASAAEHRTKPEATGRSIARLKDKVVIYDSTLQSIQSVKELPGVANDEGLVQELEATTKYFHALKSLSIARSHALAGKSLNALTLIKFAYDQTQQAAGYFSQNGSAGSETEPLNMDIRKGDAEFLDTLLRGELQRYRAIVEIDNMRAKATATAAKSTDPLVQRLYEYPADGVDLENLVAYPPKVEPIPVKPLFFDVAWNYIDYPGKSSATPAANAPKSDGSTSAPPQKKGWFSFGR